MSAEFGIVATAGAGVGINTAYQIQKGNDPFPTLFAGALWIGACVLMGAGNHSIGATLAWVYLLAVMVSRGPSFFNLISKLVEGSK